MEDPRMARRRGRRLLRWVGAGLILVAALALFYRTEFTQLWKVAHLFDPDVIVYNFQHMDELFPSRTVQRGGAEFEFGRGTYTLPATFRYADPTNHEAHAVRGDSGGAVFAKRGEEWELAGIMIAATPAVYGVGETIAADLAHYREEILSVVGAAVR